MCELTASASCDRAFVWNCKDYSDETSGQMEVMCAKFQTIEGKQLIMITFVEAQSFRDAFNAARAFVLALNNGENASALNFAPLITDEDAAAAGP